MRRAIPTSTPCSKPPARTRPRPRRRGASAVQPARRASRPDRARPRAFARRPARDWLAHASEAFERERLYLVRLTSAVGPLPSTPGAAETEASLIAAAPCAGNPRFFRAARLRAWRRHRAGRRLVADPPPARPRRVARRARLPGPVPARRSVDRRSDRSRRPTRRRASAPWLRRRAIAAPAPRPVRPARSPRRGPRATTKAIGPLPKQEPNRLSTWNVTRRLTARSIVAVGELEIAPAAALDPQRHEDVLHRDELVAELHPVGRERRRAVAERARCGSCRRSGCACCGNARRSTPDPGPAGGCAR